MQVSLDLEIIVFKNFMGRCAYNMAQAHCIKFKKKIPNFFFKIKKICIINRIIQNRELDHCTLAELKRNNLPAKQANKRKTPNMHRSKRIFSKP